MKIVNGVRIHTIELSDRSIATIHGLAMQAMAPHQALLDEIAPQLPQPPEAPKPPESPPLAGPPSPPAPPPALPSDAPAPAIPETKPT